MKKFQLWSGGEPNGGESQNCGRISYALNASEANSCFKKNCIVCNFPGHVIYILRGLCSDTLFDTHYAWSANGIDQNLQRGYSKSFIEWTEERWRINVYNNPHTYAVFEESGKTPYTGTKNWTVVNDTCGAGDGIQDRYSSRRILLSLITCTPNEFNCDDGTW